MGKRVVTRDEVRHKFPIASEVLFKGKVIGTVCGYTNHMPEPEVLYVVHAINMRVAAPGAKIGQFTVRSNSFRCRR